MQKNFPRGDMKCNYRNSNWRDFSFMLNQILQSITPSLSLNFIFKEWPNISGSLAESTRKRQNQLPYCFSERLWGFAPRKCKGTSLRSRFILFFDFFLLTAPPSFLGHSCNSSQTNKSSREIHC
ncbi:hypothetical protein Bandiella_01636 (plasmid) [Candidatus Bandiella woodruffii]|uniref:Uncharacterized protein n=1 Tax=Candidatus Bandiella euplotis TaxID=1664265 RepID=A0ABZ0UP57_9RICK|nr:hypothetical protein Bandiella_01636 [Candidatus Bandiella woodruffii]